MQIMKNLAIIYYKKEVELGPINKNVEGMLNEILTKK
jgi:hypothetical protein